MGVEKRHFKFIKFDIHNTVAGRALGVCVSYFVVFQRQKTMPSNKNKCTKCGDRHLPPTGKKCKLYKKQDNELEMEASDHISGGSDATVKHKHVQKVSVEHSSDSESDRDVETSVQM